MQLSWKKKNAIDKIWRWLQHGIKAGLLRSVGEGEGRGRGSTAPVGCKVDIMACVVQERRLIVPATRDEGGGLIVEQMAGSCQERAC